MDLSSEKVFDDDKGSKTFTSGNDKPVSSLGSTRVTPDGQKKKRPGNSNQVKPLKIVAGQILIDETGEEAEQFKKQIKFPEQQPSYCH